MFWISVFWELRNISPFFPKKTGQPFPCCCWWGVSGDLFYCRASCPAICGTTTSAAAEMAPVCRIPRAIAGHANIQNAVVWHFSPQLSLPIALGLFSYLLMKAIKCLEAQLLWQAGRIRGEHKTPVTKVFLYHLYWPDIPDACKGTPYLYLRREK